MRAAELLESSGAAGGFSVGIPFTGVESVKLGSEDTAEASDTEFNLVIKRMSKKDSTTKLKVKHRFRHSEYCHTYVILYGEY